MVIKRPLIYNTAVGQVEGLYKDFSTGKYGAAAESVGVLGLMTLAGGPVGAALRYGGKAASGLVSSVFAKPQFWETLSGYVGTNFAESDPTGLTRAMQDHFAANPDTAEDDAKALNALAETNMKGAHGSVVGAVQRIVTHYAVTPQDLTTMTHEELLQDMLKNGRAFDCFPESR